MIISAIAAMSLDRAIGVKNQIPWYMPEDLKYFKRMTLGRHILMGRKNLESLNNRPLPKRTNIIVTRNPYFLVSGGVVVHSVEEGIRFAAQNKEEELFIIGGEQIYWAAWPYLDRIYLTLIETTVPDADVFFPVIDETQWKLISNEAHAADDKNPYNYTFKVYHHIATHD